MKDSNAVYIYTQISTATIQEPTPNQSIVNCRTRSIFYKQLNEEPSRDQHEAKWNIPTVCLLSSLHPEAGRGNCLPYVLAPPSLSCESGE